MRCELPARHLPGKVTTLTSDSLVGGILTDKVYFRDQEGTCVWSVPGSRTEGRMLEGMRAMDIPCLIDVDDNYTVLADQKTDWVRDINPDDHRSLRAHKLIVQQQASGVMCSTEALADIYSGLHDNVHVCPNTVDPQDWPENPIKSINKVSVGFAGSVSHVRDDLRLVTKALRWASEQPDVEVVAIGHGRPDWDFPHLLVPWTNAHANYRWELCQLDIGLCPLVDTSWSVGKSDLKVLEYAMAGALPIISRAGPFYEWWDVLPTARTENEFLVMVKRALADPSATRARAREVREQVIRTRSTQANIDSWKEALASCA